jgi:hypothetical protein
MSATVDSPAMRTSSDIRTFTLARKAILPSHAASAASRSLVATCWTDMSKENTRIKRREGRPKSPGEIP